MRIKITKKEIIKNFKCFSVGYCDLQTLLNVANPQFYTAGVYGWNAAFCRAFIIFDVFKSFLRRLF